MDLPLATPRRTERADAARNRALVLAAAERLFAERGVSCTSMDAIAAEAGVGKGTLFRRFGDRAALALAVLDRSERRLQDAFLHGAPPLGPGAAPADRLVAFGCAALDHTREHTDLMLEAELASGGTWQRSVPHAVRWLHIRTLVAQARPDCDADYLADVLMGALSARAFVHQRQTRDMDLERVKAGFADLVARALA